MPIIEASHPDFEDESFSFLGFNVEGTIAYCSSWNSISYHGTVGEFFRISRFGESVHRIGKIEIPCYPQTLYDAKNEEIVCLGRIDYRPLLSRLNLPQGSYLRTLVTFDLTNGILKRYYNISDDNRRWLLIGKQDDPLFVCNSNNWYDTLHVCIVICLDYNGTFNLRPYNVPFYNTLAARYGFQCLVITKDHLTADYSNVPGEIIYFKLDTKQWIRENYVTKTTDKNFEVVLTYFYGLRIDEVIITENQSVHYRVLAVDQNQVWKLVCQVPVPPDGSKIRIQGTNHGEVIGSVRCEDSTMKVSIRTCAPCTLLEACISVLWPRSRQMNPQLTDYEICDRLGLSHHVDINMYFGKRFTDLMS